MACSAWAGDGVKPMNPAGSGRCGTLGAACIQGDEHGIARLVDDPRPRNPPRCGSFSPPMPSRVAALSADVAGIHFDWSKTHLTRRGDRGIRGAGRVDGPRREARRAVRGRGVNVTEGRAAEHSAERGEGAPESVARARGLHSPDARADRRDRGRGAWPGAAHPAYRHRRIGAGSRPAGRRAGARHADRYDVAVVSNVDGARAGGGARPFRSAGDLDRGRLEDLHHHRDDAQRPERARMDGGRTESRIPMAASSRSPPRPTRPSNGASTRPACCLSPKASAGAIRSGRRSAFPRRWRWAGMRSRRCSKARPRWTGISA
jgi:hypothetical protein